MSERILMFWNLMIFILPQRFAEIKIYQSIDLFIILNSKTWRMQRICENFNDHTRRKFSGKLASRRRGSAFIN